LAAAVVLALFAWTARPSPAAEPEGAQVTILADGTVTVSGGVQIPPYPGSGRWTEGTRRVSARYVVCACGSSRDPGVRRWGLEGRGRGRTR
jgi:hypothetical protein